MVTPGLRFHGSQVPLASHPHKRLWLIKRETDGGRRRFHLPASRPSRQLGSWEGKPLFHSFFHFLREEKSKWRGPVSSRSSHICFPAGLSAICPRGARADAANASTTGARRAVQGLCRFFHVELFNRHAARSQVWPRKHLLPLLWVQIGGHQKHWKEACVTIPFSWMWEPFIPHQPHSCC